MKKIFSVIAIIVMLCSSIFVLTGCGEEEEISQRKNKSKDNTSNISTSNELTDEENKKVVPQLDKTPVDIKNKDIYYFKVNGKKFTIDNKIKELESVGLKQDEDIAKKDLEPGYYMTNGGRLKAKGDKYTLFTVTPINITDKTVKCADATIGGFHVDSYSIKDYDGTIEICNGITLGTSMSDIDTIFGRPTSTYDGGTYIKYTYKVSLYKYFEFEFSSETKELKDIHWCYYDLKE